MKMWIAGASIALTTAAIPLAANAQCDPHALVSSCTIASPAANASFLELMSNDTSAAPDASSLPLQDPASDVNAGKPAATHPAVYVGGPGVVSLSQTSVAGVAGLASAGDPSLAGRAIPGWLGLSSLPSQPAPSFAWMLAIGFLGLIVVRRTRAARGF
jgi:hypothetical protein